MPALVPERDRRSVSTSVMGAEPLRRLGFRVYAAAAYVELRPSTRSAGDFVEMPLSTGPSTESRSRPLLASPAGDPGPGGGAS